MVSKPDYPADHLQNRRGRGAGFAGFLGAFWILLCTGCQQPIAEPGPAFQGDGRVVSNILVAGDVVGIAFPAASELDQSQKIRLDGKISLPMVGEVHAAGKSPKSLQEELKGRYDKHLQDPSVIVSLVSSAAIVYVNGSVVAPGKVMLDREMTVFEAIMESGGFSELANPKNVIVTRQQDGKLYRKVLNLEEDEAGEVFYVKAYDTITVSQSRF